MGKRLGMEIPKALVEIDGKPLIVRNLELLKDCDDNYLLVSYDDIENSVISNQNLIKIINKHMNDNSINPHDLKPNYLNRHPCKLRMPVFWYQISLALSLQRGLAETTSWEGV